MFWIFVSLASLSLVLFATGMIGVLTGAAPATGRGFSFAGLKAELAAGHYRRVWPPVLILSGLLGLFFFGGLAIFVGSEDKWLGSLVLLMAAYGITRTVLGFRQA